MELESNKVTCGDYASVLKNVDDKAFDFICIDPPYTNGKKKGKGKRDALSGHKIQTELDLNHVASEMYRVLKDDSFYVFFGQMPTIVEWHLAAVKAGFEFKIDIVWCKKNALGGNLRLKRTHEYIYVYSKGRCNYNKTMGAFSDVSQAQCEYNLKDIESIFRNLSYWRGIAKGRHLVDTPTPKKSTADSYFFDKGLGSKLRKSKSLGKKSIAFNSVWAFSPHNCKHRNTKTGRIKHPTVKPIPILERLIELCTHKNALVLDCFAGSGTTALACINTKRKYFLVELDKDYCDVINERIEQHNVKSELF